VIEALRQASRQLGQALAEAPAPVLSPEAVQWQQQLDQLRQLQEQGVPGLERSVADLEAKLQEPPILSGPDPERLAALFAVPGVLEGATEGQLRAVLLEFVAEVVYVGNPAEVEVRVR
jgi:hypothetical protein